MPKTTYIPAIFLASALLATSIYAQGPTETLVIINADSFDSITLARKFQSLHGIPNRNMIRIPLAGITKEAAEKLASNIEAPASNVNAAVEETIPLGITPEQFTRLIWDPVNKKIKRRGIESEILAWVYSCDFPVRITAPKGEWVSLTGITFLRNSLPEPEVIKAGAPVSPYFAGPTGKDKNTRRTYSLDRLRETGGRSAPIPAMMLGYIGERGNTLEEALQCLMRGANAGRVHAPTGTVYLVYNEDVRSKARHWQFPAAKKALEEIGIPCILSTNPPNNSVVAGMLSGHRVALTGKDNIYQPGAFTDHLTSFAAVFDQHQHSKITKWISAGASASAGTIVEPYANWAKFPNAQTFVHLGNGCTMLEALYQGVRCPLQLLMIGDPLSAAYSPRATLKVDGIPNNKQLSGNTLDLRAITEGERATEYGRIRWYVNGIEADSGPTASLSFSRRPPGVYRILCVARRRGFIRSQVWWHGDITK